MIGIEGFKAGEWVSGNANLVTSYRTWQFSGGWPPGDGWPSKNVHTDDDFARKCGLPGRAASGAMVQGYVVDFMADIFGVDWLEEGSCNLKFVAPVQIGDSVVPRARCTGTTDEDGRTRVDLELVCENQSGDVVAVGTAVGWM